MGRTLLRVAAWAAATVLAMTMSWFGVHRVLAADASGDAPQAIPIDSRATSAPRSPSPPSSPAPVTAPPTTATATTTAPPATAAPPTLAASPAASRPATAPVPPDVRSYQLTGGHVVLETTATSARLVSATPDSGWQVQAWRAAGWLRVDFSRGGTTSSCFVTWNGHPPSVQTT